MQRSKILATTAVAGLLSLTAAQPGETFVGLIDALTGSPDPDKKVYPGAMGIYRGNPNSPPFPGYRSGAITNPSQWHMDIDLPVINDDAGRGINKSYVYVVDRNYDADIRCRINSVYWNNDSDTIYGSWGPYRYSDGTSNNQQTLSTGSATHGISRHEFFSCRIPPRYQNNDSYIISYRVEEA